MSTQTTTAVRIHGVEDLRLETFDLPEIGEDEILAEVTSDSICMSTNKLAHQGEAHKRVRGSLAETPTMVGHEFCGTIKKVGSKWADQFTPGMKFAIQPALNYKGTLWAPGYSYQYIGGDATYVVIPSEVMESNCLFEYKEDSFFTGSLTEPYSCVIGAFKAQYHMKPNDYTHYMGIREGGTLAMLASVGPMGLAGLDVALHQERKPRRIVVTDIAQDRLDRAAALLTVEDAKKNGIELHYVNTGDMEDPVAELTKINEGELFDDVFVFAPVRPVVELGSKLLAREGCMNFFAGPPRNDFEATINFYDIHYSGHHYVATTGGTYEDVADAIDMFESGKLNPAVLVTHIGGLNVVEKTTLNLPNIPGGKKLIYTHKRLDLVAIDDFAERGKTDLFYAELDRLCKANNGLWNKQAEEYLLEHAPSIDE